MKNKFIGSIKRIASIILAIAVLSTAIPMDLAMADEIPQKYPYTLFAASSDEGAISVNASNFCVNGNVATNGTITTAGNMNINGSMVENACESMIYIFEKIDSQFFSAVNVDEHIGEYFLDETNVNINTPTSTTGTVVCTGNININAAFMAFEDVRLKGNVTNMNNSVLFARYGDINIDSQNANLSGLVYAPFGEVKITAQNLSLNNVVVIADKITFDCPNVNANYGAEMASFIGIESGENECLRVDTKNMIHLYGDYYQTGEGFHNLSGILAKPDDVNSFTCTVFDKNGNVIYNKPISPKFHWTSDEIGMLYGDNTVELTVTYYDGEQYTKAIHIACDLFGLSDYISVDEGDDDGDGLNNYLESYFKTDKDNPDTDGDGLSDNVEVYLLSTDPLNWDSDGNGISDADEDADFDGLTNIEEIRIGSSPIDMDSDGDGLKDGEEVLYSTSCNNVDTDDGISDYDEVHFGLDPLRYDDVNGNFTKSFTAAEFCDMYDKAVIPTVELTGNYGSISSFEMKMRSSDIFINPSVAGYVGNAYSFTVDGGFERAKLTFSLNYDYIENADSEGFEPTIYYFNEKTMQLEEVENQTRYGTEVTAELPHFSTYVVLNKREFLSRWNTNFSISEEDFYSGMLDVSYTHKDVLFLIDRSGSMASSDTNNIKSHVMDDFVDSINSQDRIAVMGFNSSTQKYTSFTSSKDEVFGALNTLASAGNYGGTNIGVALRNAESMFSSSSDSANKCIFLITDGDSSDSPSDDFLKELRGKGIRVFTVGLGRLSTRAINELKRISSLTNGQYYYAQQSNSLDSILIEFKSEITVDKDKNKDGIEDYYEYLMSTGEITTTTNCKIFCGLYDEIMSRGSDFDGDGLKNGEEIGIVFINNVPRVIVKTNPMFNDTDGDDYLDGEEVVMGTNPLVPEDVFMASDISQIGRKTQADIASDDYINGNFLLMLGERFLDVYMCGGKFEMQKMYQSAMINYLVYYDDITYGVDASSDCPNDLGTMSSALTALQIFIGFDVTELEPGANDAIAKIDYVNRTRKELNALRKSKNYNRAVYDKLAKEYHKVARKLERFEATLARYEKVSKAYKGVEKAATILCYASYTLDDVMEAITLYQHTQIAEQFCELFDDLAKRNSGDLAAAARSLSYQLNNQMGLVLTTIKDCSFDLIEAYGTLKLHGALIETGPVGIIVELVLIAGGIICKDNFSVRLQNSINSQVATEIYLMNSDKHSDTHYGYNAEGIMITAVTVEAPRDYTDAFTFSVLAKCFAEREYLRFVKNGKWFIYKTGSSEETAKANITKLNDMIYRYFNYNIPIEVQLNVS